ncbi:NADH dehydrogenase subunit 4L (mitochondrion) [Anomaloglossus baeobatrachus]|uniref:NADH-ubiquinone oxidoreductase chain 4L n=1 Tax=Anomaloglossus baeobatrachus TaxID=238106 RepID=A0A342KAJ3_ANOBA|nr:NADH dehydrogenase subunit 4L [Anomaloglossus baeobatrachus]ANA07503.1 NADH dehydrogenase subunit 4L [Anomaloglossus baeobatrachus]AYW03860.1 NADH dehydrogenase subunit 4L [Anomaloglossus baeobatrachus]AYW03886.1 NADH dehydrogenase subunit 4L [Anomaloglossus baeobatrachus]AYW03951.1 NADH dehydrogenase subunit 4L [Anomaloglossus baeobatrachus]AYW03974.1 NADH dehydrogenase subunit 4L [Anomaloglossus baeobatrachus]
MLSSHEPWLLSTTFFLGLLGLSFHRTHLLSALLCLEGMMLSLYLGLALWTAKMTMMSSGMFPVIMLTLSACEAGLGLSLMIATARSHGSDNLNSLNLLQC